MTSPSHNTLPATDTPPLLRRRADIEHDLFATIVEEASSEILVFDAETLALVLANRSSRNNLGYAPAEIAGLGVADIKAEFPEAGLKEIYRPFLDGETARMVVHTTPRRSARGMARGISQHAREKHICIRRGPPGTGPSEKKAGCYTRSEQRSRL